MKALPWFLVCVLLAVPAHAQKITAYGYKSDLTPDSNSSNGIGNHNNQLVPYGSGGFTSAALTPEFANQYGVSLNQNFTFTAANGQTYNLTYADTVPTGGPGQQPAGSLAADIYDPNSVLANGGNDNNFETSVNGVVTPGPIQPSTPSASAGIIGQGAMAAANSGVQTLNTRLIDPIISMFQNAASNWLVPIRNAALVLFWILALIRLALALIWALLKDAGFQGLLAELVNFVLVVGFFYWLLLHGASFGNIIIASLRQLGGEASGSQQIFPGDVVTSALQVFNQALLNAKWYQLELAIEAILLAIGILVLCGIIAANMVLLLCSAYVVVYAGVIFLGFGAIGFTSDMAIGYYRAVLAIAVKLFVLGLIMGMCNAFLQNLINQTATSISVGALSIIFLACLILALLAHKLPQTVADMAFGSHTGNVGTVGMMTAMLAAGGLLRAFGRAGGAAAGGAAGSASNDLLRDRIQAGEAAMAAGSVQNGSNGSNGTSEASAATSRPSGGYSAPVAASSAAPGGSSSVYKVSTANAGKKTATGSMSAPKPADEPPLTRPLSPDEQWELDHPEFL